MGFAHCVPRLCTHNEPWAGAIPLVCRTPLVLLNSTPPRTTVAFADVVNFNRGARVWVKNRNRGMQSTPRTVPPLSSPGPCGTNVEPSVTTRPHHVLFVESGSLGSPLVLETLAPGQRLGTPLHCHPQRKAKLPQEATNLPPPTTLQVLLFLHLSH
jgi:hypothetical protein